jgi:hypothetical protein
MRAEDKAKAIFRRYRPDDKDQLIKLYEKVWGKDKADQIALIWDWKFHGHPDIIKGEYYSSLVAEKEGKIVGFIGALPTKFKAGQKVHDGFSLGDHMVDPKNRGRLGIRLTKTMLKSESTLMGHADTGTYKDKISYRLWSKLRSSETDVTYIHNMIKRLSIEKAVKKRSKIHSLAVLADWMWRRVHNLIFWFRTGGSIKPGLAIEKIDRFSENMQPLLNELVDQNENIILRTPENLNWRIFERPNVKYDVLLARRGGEPAGLIILRTLKHNEELHGRIVEFIAKKDDRDCFKFLLKTAINKFWDKKATLVQAYGTPSFSKKELELAGFSTRKVKHPLYPVLGECPDENFFNHDAWHMSLLDSDFDMD